MLGQYPVHVVLLSLDLGETKAFYHDQLGIEILDENEEAITFKCGGESSIAVTKSTVGTSDEQTQAGWFVPDLDAELAELRSRGVVVQEYDMPGLKTTTESPTSASLARPGSSTRTETRSGFSS